MNVTSSARTLDSTFETKAGFVDNTTRLSNISATANRPNKDVESVTFEATVERERLAILGVNPVDVSFY